MKWRRGSKARTKTDSQEVVAPPVGKQGDKPWLGAAYYPEDWPAQDIDAEIELMRQCGMSVMRIGEFAWSRLEPREGRYDFGWLHNAVDKLGKAGISTIMGTPTCTPPAWLTEQYSEILKVDDNGRRATHGARTNFCPNNTDYRAFCGKIVTRMAEEFARDKNVVGWQIDNELYPYGARGCCCPVCLATFRKRLLEQFGSVDKLNEAWGTHLWSQTYQSFSQIPVPSASSWHHPSLIYAWMKFASDSIVEYAAHQAEILHKLVTQPVGTDMMPVFGLDYAAINRKLDVVQHNHYHMMDTMWESIFWFDMCRTILPAPFWNTETSTCWFGGTTAKGYREPGYCRANSWIPIALGGEANLYWLWRAHWSGQELMHGSVISSCMRPLHIFDEVKEISAGYSAASGFLAGTRPSAPGVALHVSTDASLLLASQPMVEKFDYRARIMDRFHKPLVKAQYRLDAIYPSADLDAYRVVLTPFLPVLAESGLDKRIVAWIEAGGTWIVGPLSDTRTPHGTKFTHAPYGCLEELAGVRCKYEIPGEPRDFALRWEDGTESKGSIWYDAMELNGAESLASYTEGPMKDLAAVVRRKIGRGQIMLLGTVPQPADLVRLLAGIGKKAGIAPVAEASDNLLVVPRDGAAGRGMVLVEYENKPAWITLDTPLKDILSGARVSGRVALTPYQVMVLAGG
jgi:beta-galactosidase